MLSPQGCPSEGFVEAVKMRENSPPRLILMATTEYTTAHIAIADKIQREGRDVASNHPEQVEASN